MRRYASFALDLCQLQRCPVGIWLSHDAHILEDGGKPKLEEGFATKQALSQGVRALSKPNRNILGVFTGQGAQWAGMGKQLLADEPAFAAAVDELEADFVAQVGFSLKDVLLAGEPVVGIDRIQPVLVGMQLALTALWRSYGVDPDAVIGHSMGEVTAAVVSGALSPADGLKVIATRSKLMKRLSGQGAVSGAQSVP